MSSRLELPTPSVVANPTATVFVADGAGDYRMLSRTMRATLHDDGQPIEVITCAWSHGKFRSLADHLDNRHARREGQKLADTIRAHRAAYPDRAIHLAGHSAGATVALAALENLPPNFVDEVILIAPSVSAQYDPRPALQAVRVNMHVFYSPNDYFFLGFVTRLLGSPDRYCSVSSGRVGFRTPSDDGKLVQHAWQPSDAALGNYGGHFGGYQPEFLRRRVLSLLEHP